MSGMQAILHGVIPSQLLAEKDLAWILFNSLVSASVRLKPQ